MEAVPPIIRFLKKWPVKSYNPWRIHGAAIYGVPWIPSIYPLYLNINIQAHHGSVVGYDLTDFNIGYVWYISHLNLLIWYVSRRLFGFHGNRCWPIPIVRCSHEPRSKWLAISHRRWGQRSRSPSGPIYGSTHHARCCGSPVVKHKKMGFVIEEK